jgi:lycopene cyclase domain-containing protein
MSRAGVKFLQEKIYQPNKISLGQIAKPGMYTYLLINILTLLFAIACSFEKKVRFVKYWLYLLPAIILTGAFCLLWNHYFALWKIWSFNPEHVCGIYFFGLPLEQFLFFISVPFACIFIYEFINVQFPGPGPGYRLATSISWSLVLLLCIVAYLNSEKVYTALAAVFALTLLLQHLLVFRQKYLGRFYRTWLVCLIPFMIIDAVLANLVVTYDPEHLTGAAVFNIPAEDFIYFFFMLLLNLTIYEYAKGKKRAAALLAEQAAEADTSPLKAGQA